MCLRSLPGFACNNLGGAKTSRGRRPARLSQNRVNPTIPAADRLCLSRYGKAEQVLLLGLIVLEQESLIRVILQRLLVRDSRRIYLNQRLIANSRR